MGLKKMLEQGVANEHEQLNKASKSTTPIEEPYKDSEYVQEDIKQSSEPAPQEKNNINSTPKKKDKKNTKEKNPGGRPTNEKKGIKSRKQYTLTLKEDTYKMILEEAGKEEISFAKFMERAAIEYINIHK